MIRAIGAPRHVASFVTRILRLTTAVALCLSQPRLCHAVVNVMTCGFTPRRLKPNTSEIAQAESASRCAAGSRLPSHRPELAVTPSSSQNAAPSTDYSEGRATTDRAALVAREHLPWRSVAAGATVLGTSVGIGVVLHPMLGEIVAIVELVVALTIIGAALFGSTALSERAFRLLRWIGNRPEPPAPTSGRRPGRSLG